MAPQGQPLRPGAPSGFTSFQGQANTQFHLKQIQYEKFECNFRALYNKTSERLERIGVPSHGALVGPPLVKRQRQDSTKLLAAMNDFKDDAKKSYGVQVAKLTQRGDVLNRAEEQISAKLAEIQKRKTMLKTREAKAAEVRERQALFDARKGELEKTQAEVRDLQARLQAESQSLQRAQGEMGAQRMMTSELHSQLEAKLEAKKQRASQLYSQLEDGRNQLRQLQAELGAEKQTVSELRSQLDDGRNQLRQLQAELGAEKQTVSELRSQLDAQEHRVSESDYEAFELRGNIQILEQRISVAKCISNHFERSTAAKRREISDLNDALATSSTEVGEKDARIHQLESSASDAEATILTEKSKCTSLEDEVSELKSRLKQSDDALATSSTEVGEKDSRIRHLEETVRAAEAATATERSNYGLLNAKLSGVESELAHMRTAWATSCTEAGEKDTRIRELGENVASLKQERDATLAEHRKQLERKEQELEEAKRASTSDSRVHESPTIHGQDTQTSSSQNMQSPNVQSSQPSSSQTLQSSSSQSLQPSNSELEEYMVQLPGQDASSASDMQKRLMKKVENRCTAKNRKRLKSFFAKDRNGEYCMESFCIHQKRSDWDGALDIACKRCEKQQIACVKLLGEKTRVMLPLRAELREGRQPSEEKYWVV